MTHCLISISYQNLIQKKKFCPKTNEKARKELKMLGSARKNRYAENLSAPPSI